MKILDLYIIKKFISTFLFVFLLFAVISVVWDLGEKWEDLVDKATFKEIVLYYLNFEYYIGIMLSPLYIFIAVVFFTSRLAENSELMVMYTSGISFGRLLVPYFVAAFFLSAGLYYAHHWLFPLANTNRIAFENTYINYINRFSELDYHMQIDDDTYIYVNRYHHHKNEGYKFALEKISNGKLTYKLRAKRIRWDSTNGSWQIHNYVARTITSTGEQIVQGKRLDTVLNLTPKEFGKSKDVIETLSTPKLKAFIERERMKGSDKINLYLVKQYERTSSPFSTFILTLIAVAISSRKLRGGIGLNIAMGFLIAFAYIFFMKFSVTLSINANFPPLLGVWAPNILFGLLGIYLVRFSMK